MAQFNKKLLPVLKSAVDYLPKIKLEVADEDVSPEHEGKMARALRMGKSYREQLASGAPADMANYADRFQPQDFASSFPGEASEQSLEQQEKERHWAKRMSKLRTLSSVGSKVARFAGQGQLAEALGNVGSEFGAAGKAGAGAGANLMGSGASKFAQSAKRKKPLSSGKGSALGGAVAGALGGEGVKGIGQNALSWYVVDAMFILLLDPTFIISPLALFYLNVHYLMSKKKSKWFRPMFLWQKYTLLFADILFIFILLTILAILYFAYRLYTDPVFALKFGLSAVGL